MKDVSIIIVSYNTCQITIDCINSIYEHTRGVNFEIIVVDNASIDDSPNRIISLFPAVTVVENNENVGFGRANNIGFKYSDAKYIFLLNSDSILLNNAVKNFFDYMENIASEDIGCVGSMLLSPEGQNTLSWEKFPTSKGILCDIVIRYLKRNQLYSEKSMSNKDGFYFRHEVDYICGAALFIPSKTFETFNGFDERFFIYFEETDLQYRFFKSGLRRLIINEPQIIHLEGKSHSESNFKRCNYTEGAMRYIKKHSSFVNFLLFKSIYFVLRIPSLFSSAYERRENIDFFKSIVYS